MKRFFAITVVMLLSSAVFFVVVCAGADPVVKTFKGTWTGKTFLLGQGGPCGSSETLDFAIGKGVNTLTGASDWLSVSCNQPPDQYGRIESVGWAIITASDGDELHISTWGVITFVSQTSATWYQESDIVGGTGRFEGASSDTPTISTGVFDLVTDPGAFPPGVMKAVWSGNQVGEIRY